MLPKPIPPTNPEKLPFMKNGNEGPDEGPDEGSDEGPDEGPGSPDPGLPECR